jgi:hypothetical protein
LSVKPTPDTQRAAEIIGDYCDEIKRLFKPPMRITVLVRIPDFPDGTRDFVLTDDKLDDAAAALLMRKPENSIVGAV